MSTPCQETKIHLNWKVGSERTQIGPVLEVTICFLQGKYGVEIRIKSVNKDISHSWVIISHGLKKLVTNLNNKEQDDNEQETSEIQFEEYALKLNAGDFASRSKATAKPQKRDSASLSTRTVPIGERIWTDVELGKYSLSDCSLSRKLIHLLRHGSLPRDNDMERLNSGEQNIIFFRIILCFVIIGLTKNGRTAWQEEEDKRKDSSIVLILQEQSCTPELFKVIRDAILLILYYWTMS